MGPGRGAASRLLRALVGPDTSSAKQGFYALLISSGGDLLAGVTLGSIPHTLETLPGLLVLIPAAIGMRGNIFGALGSRLGTAIHTGTFSLSPTAFAPSSARTYCRPCVADVRHLAGRWPSLAKSIAVAFDLGPDLAARLRSSSPWSEG